MKNRIVALAFAFVASLTLSAVVETAEARRGHSGGQSSSFRSHAGPRVHSFHHRHAGIRYVPMAPRQFHRNYFHAGPRHYQRNYIYSGSRYMAEGCSWLRHRALATGSRHWWQRYHACRTGLLY